MRLSAYDRNLGLRFFVALFVFVSSTICFGKQASLPTLKLQVSINKEIVLFDHAKDACEAWDIPDTPTRAYRGSDGLVHVFQTHFLNRAMVGKTLLSVKRQCHIAFKGDENEDPSKFNDKGWIASTYTDDGKTIYGIVHNEFHAHLRPKLCPNKDYMSCWYNALTMAVSKDSGANFKLMQPSFLAAVPFKQSETVGHHAGFFEPTNIVKHGKYLYFMSNVVSPNKANSGNCLFRAKSWQDKKGWQVWRDNTFSTRIDNPYSVAGNVSKHVCDPIDSSHLIWPVTSLVQYEPTKTWIALSMGRYPASVNKPEQRGFFYMTSQDLMKWSAPSLLLSSPINSSFNCTKDEPIAYPALIDDNSSSQNFDKTDGQLYLTFVRTHPESCKLSHKRNLVALPVFISVEPS